MAIIIQKNDAFEGGRIVIDTSEMDVPTPNNQLTPQSCLLIMKGVKMCKRCRQRPVSNLDTDLCICCIVFPRLTEPFVEFKDHIEKEKNP